MVFPSPCGSGSGEGNARSNGGCVHPSPYPLPQGEGKSLVVASDSGCGSHNFSNRIALPLAIFALSSAHSGIVGSQSVPGLFSTNG